MTMDGVSQGAIRFGVQPIDSHILVPGNVTVSPVTSPPVAAAVEEGRVRVEMSAGQSVRYEER
jgi:hypothetical protein